MTRLQRFSYAWYAHAFLRELVLIYPTSAIMMTGSGISPLELSSLFMIWGVAALLGEIPSGAIADLTSRRNILMVSGLMKGCAFLTWLAFPSYGGFAAGFIVWGTASAMSSGASEALLYDTLREEDATAQFSRIYGRAEASANLGVALALLIGGFVAEGGYPLPLILSAAAPWIAAMVLLVGIREPSRRTDALRSRTFVGTLRDAVSELRRNRVVAFVVLMLGVLGTLWGALEEYVPVFLDDRSDLRLGSIGIIFALAYAARTVGMASAHRLPGAPVPNAVRLFVIAGLILATTALPNGWWLALPIALYSGAAGAAAVLLQTRLQHGVEGPARATVTSAAGVVEGIFEFPLYLSIGLTAQLGGWQAAFTMIAMLTVVLSLGFRFFAPRELLR